MTPEFANLAAWLRLSGMSRSSTYEAIRDGHLTAHRVAGRVMIDVPAGLSWMRAQPRVELKAAETGR